MNIVRLDGSSTKMDAIKIWQDRSNKSKNLSANLQTQECQVSNEALDQINITFDQIILIDKNLYQLSNSITAMQTSLET